MKRKKWNCCKKINGTFVDTLKIIQDLYRLGFRVISHEVNMNTPPLLDRYPIKGSTFTDSCHIGIM